MVAPRASRASSEAGYSLVVLVIAVTVLNILVAAMLPLWSTAIKREKEEELIFRGFQYAEAIRVFRLRYQHPPNRLEELLEVKPRCIRQLWKDPMTEDGKWALIFENQPQGPLTPKPGGDADKDGRDREDDGDGGDEGDGDSGPQFGPKKGEEVQIGPIIGVRSKSSEKSMILLFGRERYDEWDFTETRLTQLVGGGSNLPRNVGGVGMPAGPQFSTRWLGRPMRGVDQQAATGLPQDGTLPNGQGPGLNGPQPSRPPRGTSKPPGRP